MRYIVLKRGLEIFDATRAYGLAACLYFGSGYVAPLISDTGTAYLLEHDAKMPERIQDKFLREWEGLFAGRQWDDIFRTYKQGPRKAQVDKVKDILTGQFSEVIESFVLDQHHTTRQTKEKPETLPGPLEPTAFKGLRTQTRGNYTESQVKVDVSDWALSCLGGSIIGRYIPQPSAAGKWEYYATYWLPERVTFDGVLHLREILKDARLSYIGIENAAAHQAVILAKAIRRRALTELKHADRFSDVVFFTLFQSGQQIKPSSAGRVSLSHLLKLALNPKPEAENVLNIWEYLFRRGSVQGAEDLAVAITEFVMRPNLDTFERHIKEFIRYLGKGVKGEFQYDEKTLREVMAYV
jgi:hypothetical protein